MAKKIGEQNEWLWKAVLLRVLILFSAFFFPFGILFQLFQPNSKLLLATAQLLIPLLMKYKGIIIVTAIIFKG